MLSSFAATHTDHTPQFMEPPTNPETSEQPSGPLARIHTLAAHQPAKVFFWIGASGIALMLFAYRLQRIFGNTPFSHQGHLERSIRMMMGMFVAVAPHFLFYALIYWLLYHFKRPTSPRLNVLHLQLTAAGYGGMILYYGLVKLSDKKTTYTTALDASDIVFAILSLLIMAVFVVNVVTALRRKTIG